MIKLKGLIDVYKSSWDIPIYFFVIRIGNN